MKENNDYNIWNSIGEAKHSIIDRVFVGTTLLILGVSQMWLVAQELESNSQLVQQFQPLYSMLHVIIFLYLIKPFYVACWESRNTRIGKAGLVVGAVIIALLAVVAGGIV